MPHCNWISIEFFKTNYYWFQFTSVIENYKNKKKIKEKNGKESKKLSNEKAFNIINRNKKNKRKYEKKNISFGK